MIFCRGFSLACRAYFIVAGDFTRPTGRISPRSHSRNLTCGENSRALRLRKGCTNRQEQISNDFSACLNPFFAGILCVLQEEWMTTERKSIERCRRRICAYFTSSEFSDLRAANADRQAAAGAAAPVRLRGGDSKSKKHPDGVFIGIPGISPAARIRAPFAWRINSPICGRRMRSGKPRPGPRLRFDYGAAIPKAKSTPMGFYRYSRNLACGENSRALRLENKFSDLRAANADR